jgi:hypothetical protein
MSDDVDFPDLVSAIRAAPADARICVAARSSELAKFIAGEAGRPDAVCVAFGDALMGYRFDRIFVDDSGLTRSAHRWLDQIHCRLSPSGKMIFGARP